MTQIRVFCEKTKGKLENEVNAFLETIDDSKVSIQYGTNAYYYECLITYEINKEKK